MLLDGEGSIKENSVLKLKRQGKLVIEGHRVPRILGHIEVRQVVVPRALRGRAKRDLLAVCGVIRHLLKR